MSAGGLLEQQMGYFHATVSHRALAKNASGDRPQSANAEQMSLISALVAQPLRTIRSAWRRPKKWTQNAAKPRVASGVPKPSYDADAWVRTKPVSCSNARWVLPK